MFPLLRERCGSDDGAVLEVLERVERDHLEMAGVWRGLDASLARISLGADVALDEDAVAQFAAMYDQHIDAEETVLLPALRRFLRDADWSVIGRSMAARRGLEDKGGPRHRG